MANEISDPYRGTNVAMAIEERNSKMHEFYLLDTIHVTEVFDYTSKQLGAMCMQYGSMGGL